PQQPLQRVKPREWEVAGDRANAKHLLALQRCADQNQTRQNASVADASHRLWLHPPRPAHAMLAQAPPPDRHRKKNAPLDQLRSFAVKPPQSPQKCPARLPANRVAAVLTREVRLRNWCWLRLAVCQQWHERVLRPSCKCRCGNPRG